MIPHTVKITGGPVGEMTSIELDGHKIAPTAVTVDLEVGLLNRVHITLDANVDIDLTTYDIAISQQTAPDPEQS